MLNFSFFSFAGWGIDLDYCDIERFALETNRDHSVVFETASSKYVIKRKCALHTKALNVIEDFEQSNLETPLFYVLHCFNVDMKLNKVCLALYPI